MRIHSTLLLLVASIAVPASAAPATQPAGGVAVVELFSSEGCSSCPPAEQYLATVAKRADAQHEPIFTLAFHVDYWNNLGWRDPFSDAAYSERQNQYARVMNLNSVYTPQMIVNGTTQFVGSNKSVADKAIAAAVATPAEVHVTAKLSADRQLDASIDGASGVVINVAVVEREATSKIMRGENAGRTLTESNIVRWFKSITPDGAGHAAVRLPADAHGSFVVVYAQRSSDLAILGATSVALQP